VEQFAGNDVTFKIGHYIIICNR